MCFSSSVDSKLIVLSWHLAWKSTTVSTFLLRFHLWFYLSSLGKHAFPFHKARDSCPSVVKHFLRNDCFPSLYDPCMRSLHLFFPFISLISFAARVLLFSFRRASKNLHDRFIRFLALDMLFYFEWSVFRSLIAFCCDIFRHIILMPWKWMVWMSMFTVRGLWAGPIIQLSFCWDGVLQRTVW